VIAVLVFHDAGDPAGGEPWRDAFQEAEWPGAVLAPDLPGHGTERAPVGGSYELADPVLFAIRVMRTAELGEEPPVVVGVGVNGWSAQVLALGGRASAVVLVDGLNGPWVDARATIGAGRDWIRAIAADPAAVAPAPPVGLDPRLAHGLVPHGSRRLADRAAAAMPVPVLLVETPHSLLALDDVEELAGRYKSGAAVASVPDRAPTTVAARASLWRCTLPESPGSITHP